MPRVADPDEAERLAQERYERTLLHEISKLQAALAEERNSHAAAAAELQMEQDVAREKKVSQSEKASRLQAMETAIEEAQKVEQGRMAEEAGCGEVRQAGERVARQTGPSPWHMPSGCLSGQASSALPAWASERKLRKTSTAALASSLHISCPADVSRSSLEVFR